jgi:hypothetical protein
MCIFDQKAWDRWNVERGLPASWEFEGPPRQRPRYNMRLAVADRRDAAEWRLIRGDRPALLPTELLIPVPGQMPLERWFAQQPPPVAPQQVLPIEVDESDIETLPYPPQSPRDSDATMADVSSDDESYDSQSRSPPPELSDDEMPAAHRRRIIDPEQGSTTIFVRTLAGTSLVFTVGITEDVLSLTNRIAFVVRVPSRMWGLAFKGRVVEMQRTMGELGVSRDDHFTMVAGLGGGVLQPAAAIDDAHSLDGLSADQRRDLKRDRQISAHSGAASTSPADMEISDVSSLDIAAHIAGLTIGNDIDQLTTDPRASSSASASASDALPLAVRGSKRDADALMGLLMGTGYQTATVPPASPKPS